MRTLICYIFIACFVVLLSFCYYLPMVLLLEVSPDWINVMMWSGGAFCGSLVTMFLGDKYRIKGE
jgi:hypothetical protein